MGIVVHLINSLVALICTLTFDGLFMPLRFDLKSFVVLLIIFLSACASPPISISEIDRMTARAKQIEIIRDDFGVPHIYGKTDADAVFCLLHA